MYTPYIIQALLRTLASQGSCLRNIYRFRRDLDLGVLKILLCVKYTSFKVRAKYVVRNLKKINPQKISCPLTKKNKKTFYQKMKFQELLNLRAISIFEMSTFSLRSLLMTSTPTEDFKCDWNIIALEGQSWHSSASQTVIYSQNMKNAITKLTLVVSRKYVIPKSPRTHGWSRQVQQNLCIYNLIMSSDILSKATP